MQPQPPADRPSDDRFRHRLDHLIDRRHELVRFATLIDWERFDREWGYVRVGPSDAAYAPHHGEAQDRAGASGCSPQQRQDNNKRYALQAPEVECIATGKVPKRFDPTW